MAKLVNNAARFVIVGRVGLVPGKPVEVGDLQKLTTLYPELATMIERGDISELTEKAAAKAEADFEKMEVDELKAYAKKKGINIGRASKKETILAAINEAKAKKYAEKG
jgi:hypothetical protein